MINVNNNPFGSEAAAKMKPSEILDVYIPDYSHTESLLTRKNIFLEGERGVGKSIALKFNSTSVQILQKGGREKIQESKILAIYIPCNTPITHRREHELLNEFHSSLISNHFLVANIMTKTAEELTCIENPFSEDELNDLTEELEYSLDISINRKRPLFDQLQLIFQKELSNSEKQMNSGDFENLHLNCRTFSSGVLPLCTSLRKYGFFKDMHFAFFIDDCQELNYHQVRSINTWIAYRDNTIFSFKVATTKVERPDKTTNVNGSILEGHDYISIDMEEPWRSMNQNYKKLAQMILEKRIEKIAPNTSLDQFFPQHAKTKKHLEIARAEEEKEARIKFPSWSNKQITDYVYKRYRARFFRQRSAHANLPFYSGSDVIIHLSTGNIRYLLEPCYYMYQSFLRNNEDLEDGKRVSISPSIQNSAILTLSKKKWNDFKFDLVKHVKGCTQENATRLYNLIDKLVEFFALRLKSDISEPRAVAFTISEQNSHIYSDLVDLLKIGLSSRILYTYRGSSKSEANREDYYVINRIFLPERGLDVVGQNARVSIKASDLWNSAVKGTHIPTAIIDSDNQLDLI